MAHIKTNYSEHFEILVALVAHLSVHVRDNRDDSNAPRLAGHLGFQRDEVEHVLETYRGLFRRSQSNSFETPKYGPQRRYSLQLRYAAVNMNQGST